MKKLPAYILMCTLFVACNDLQQSSLQEMPKSDQQNGSTFLPVTESKWPKDRIGEVYTAAIAEYLREVYKDENSRPDTLYIGNHPDFPAITLPQLIEQSNIRLVTFEETGHVKDNKDFVFLNMAGWLSENEGEFILVTFKQGYRPQHNCHINLKYNEEKHGYELTGLTFEYVYDKK